MSAWQFTGVMLLLLTALLAPQPGFAAAPANDLCTSPQLISANSFPYTTPAIDITDATTQPSDPLPSNPFLADRVVKSVWYRFTPARNGVYTINSCSDSGTATTVADTVLGVYTSSGGCNGPFTEQAEGDEDCGPNGAQASVSLALTADTTYYIVVWKFCDNCVDDGLNQLQLIISASVPPDNDSCTNPTTVFLNQPVSGTTVGANDSYRLSGNAGFGGLDQIESPAAGRDVVYSFTAPAAGSYSIKALRYDVQQNLVLYTLRDCPSVGTPPISISNFPAAANRSRVNSAEHIVGLQLAQGQRTLIVVDDHDPANEGSTFVLEVTSSVREQETNNTPATASALACGIEGSISPQADTDVFVLGHYPAGWRVFALVDAEAAANASFDLQVHTATGTVLQYDDDHNDIFFGDSAPNVAGTPLPGESAFLSIGYSVATWASEPYRLYAVVQPPLQNAAPEIEPNGDKTHANVDARNYFFGILQAPASPGDNKDEDVYQFSVAEGDLIFVSLDGDPYRTNSPINARLELLDASFNQVFLVDDSAASSSTDLFPDSPSEGLVYRSAVEGAFFARVSISPAAAGNAAAGAYLLSISKNCAIGAFGQNHPPTFTNVTFPSTVGAGAPSLVTGTVRELDTGDALTLEIRWGDGTTNKLNFSEPGQFEFTLSHVYMLPNTSHTVTLTVTDRAGLSDSLTRSLQVSSPALQIAPPQNGRVDLHFQGKPLGRYRVEKSESLRSWSELITVTADATGAVAVQDPAATVSSRFYRVVEVN